MNNKIGILGTGSVGACIGSKLIELGYPVMMGSRTANNEKATAWAEKNGKNASAGTFADAATFGEIIFLCTKGEFTLAIIESAGKVNFAGKTVIDISNPLDFSKGMPPTLFVCNTDSLGEQVQAALPDAHIVKTLNTVNANVMVNPDLANQPTMLVSGNDAGAKAETTDILKQFGWQDVLDLGDITSARASEMMLIGWLRAWQATGNINVAFKVHR